MAIFDKNTQNTINAVVVILIIVFVWGYISNKKLEPEVNAHTKLAQCLAEKDVEFLGAWWCPFCSYQKSLFTGSANELPYVECSTTDAERTTLQVCIDKEITSFPTWDFADGLRCPGALEPIILAHLSGCSFDEYDEEDTATRNDVEALYFKLVESKPLPNNITGEQAVIYNDARREQVNQFLTNNFGTTLDTETNTSNLLTAISRVINRCSYN